MNNRELKEILTASLCDNDKTDELISLLENGDEKAAVACQKIGSCVIKDDAVAIEQSVLNADVVAFATPIYYYEMSGQMKTLIDRMNSLYAKDYKFTDIYFMATAAEDEEYVPQRAVEGLKGWIDCFENAELKGTVFCGGVDAPNAVEGNAKINEAYEMGRNI